VCSDAIADDSSESLSSGFATGAANGLFLPVWPVLAEQRVIIRPSHTQLAEASLTVTIITFTRNNLLGILHFNLEKSALC
jgi:hypothetical protein